MMNFYPSLCGHSILILFRGCVAQELNEASCSSAGDAAPDKADSRQTQKWLRVHGFVLGAVSGRTTGEQVALGQGGDFVLGEGRLRLNVSGLTPSGKTRFVFKGDAVSDGVTRSVYADIREGYASYTAGRLEFQAGRQIITWGLGDLLFINDVFPKDWESFFSGRPPEYLKLGADGASMSYSSQVLNVELVVLPFFTSDQLPSAERFVFFNPYTAIPNQHQENPASNLGDTEVAVRLSRRSAGFDASVYAYRGFWRDPSVRLNNPTGPSSATSFFPGLSVYGLSAQRGASVAWSAWRRATTIPEIIEAERMRRYRTLRYEFLPDTSARLGRTSQSVFRATQK